MKDKMVQANIFGLIAGAVVTIITVCSLWGI